MTRANCDPKEPSDHAAIPAKRVSSTLFRIPLRRPSCRIWRLTFHWISGPQL